MSELNRSELEAQSIELLPAREEMRHRRGRNALIIGGVPIAQDEGTATVNNSVGGNGGAGISQTSGEGGNSDNQAVGNITQGGQGGQGGISNVANLPQAW